MDDKNHFIVTRELALKQDKRHGNAETFVYEPSNVEEDLLGNLYIIGRAGNRKKDLNFIPNLIASLMRREFYKPGNEPPETRFESGLKKANAALLDIETTNPGAADNIELAIINIARDKIRISQIGNLIALLYRDREIIHLNQANSERGKREFFSSVVAGDILQNDKLIFSTAKLIDLFSDEGIKKLGTLNIEKQADIINRLYQKNCQDAPLPDQAAILLEIRDYQNTRLVSFKKRIIANPPIKKYFANAIKIRLSKKGGLAIGGVLFLVIALIIYLPIQNKFSIARKISEQIKEADKISATDKKSALDILEEAQRSATPILSTWYISGVVKKLSADISVRINELNGIYKKIPVEWAKIDIEAIKFNPRYIFYGGANYVYIFSSSADMVYKIKKSDRSSSFTPLHIENTFAIERTVEEAGYLYLVNDTKKSAYIFYPETEETAPVIKSLKRILTIPEKQNSKTSENASYYLSGQDKIIKETKSDKSQKTFLLSQPVPTIIDFTVAKDEKTIYLLSENKILTIESE